MLSSKILLSDWSTETSRSQNSSDTGWRRYPSDKGSIDQSTTDGEADLKCSKISIGPDARADDMMSKCGIRVTESTQRKYILQTFMGGRPPSHVAHPLHNFFQECTSASQFEQFL